MNYIKKLLRRVSGSHPDLRSSGNMFGAGAFSGQPSSGVYVNEYVAMNYSAVFACTRVIAETIATLSWFLYERDGDSKQKATGHPVFVLLHNEPNPEMSSFTFRETLQAHALGWGNGYAEIVRDGSGRPIYMWPIAPERVTPDRDSSGNVIYRVANDESMGRGEESILRADQMFHR